MCDGFRLSRKSYTDSLFPHNGKILITAHKTPGKRFLKKKKMIDFAGFTTKSIMF